MTKRFDVTFCNEFIVCVYTKKEKKNVPRIVIIHYILNLYTFKYK